MSKKFILTLIFSSLLLLLTFLSYNFHPTFLEIPQKPQPSIHVISHAQIAESHCDGTLYPQLCVSTVAAVPNLRQKTLPEVISATINVTMKEVQATASNCSSIRRKLMRSLQPLELRALDDCLTLFSTTISQLRTILAELSTTDSPETAYYDDLQTLLSGGMTNQNTCLDGFASSANITRKLIGNSVNKISKRFSNALSMVRKMMKRSAGKPKVDEAPATGFPSWVKGSDRRLLQATAGNATRPNLVVAQDGSGNFSSINVALSAAPNNSNTRFVIYIKTGAYYEYVAVVSNKVNIMFLGDGIGKTQIKGNRNVVDGWTTFGSATLAVSGNGFIAQGITVENYAGPSKHQAVAVRTSADFAVFYRCSFIGYQDTLYTHSLRQFYRECDVYGTIDFIFGNAAVVLQSSNLYARRPNANQSNVFTAQGRDDPNQNTGTSIINCKVAAAADLIPVVSQFRSYLGRPWKQYSRTVYMFSNMEGLLDPKGWLPWDGDFALATLYYGEYRNRGPGSNTTARVTWPGYRVMNNETEASQFTVANFIQGNVWLPATGVPFYPNLTATT